MKGLYFIDYKDYVNAETALRKATNLNWSNWVAHDDLGDALKEQGKLDDAIAEYRRAIELDPKDAETHNDLGAVLRDQGKFDEAIAEYRRTIEIDPKNAGAHAALDALSGENNHTINNELPHASAANGSTTQP